MTKVEQPSDAQRRVESAIEELSEVQAELEAEKIVSHAKGYISALRYTKQIEHEVFKALNLALDEARSNWHRKIYKRASTGPTSSQ